MKKRPRKRRNNTGFRAGIAKFSRTARSSRNSGSGLDAGTACSLTNTSWMLMICWMQFLTPLLIIIWIRSGWTLRLRDAVPSQGANSKRTFGSAQKAGSSKGSKVSYKSASKQAAVSARQGKSSASGKFTPKASSPKASSQKNKSARASKSRPNAVRSARGRGRTGRGANHRDGTR